MSESDSNYVKAVLRKKTPEEQRIYAESCERLRKQVNRELAVFTAMIIAEAHRHEKALLN